MKETRKQIEVSKEVRGKMMRAFECSEPTVWRALNFVSTSDLSERMRKYAMLNGGVLLLIVPATETVHDAEGYMRQYFPNGATLEANKADGTVRVYDRKGEQRAEVVGCSIAELETLQNIAGGL